MPGVIGSTRRAGLLARRDVAQRRLGRRAAIRIRPESSTSIAEDDVDHFVDELADQGMLTA